MLTELQLGQKQTLLSLAVLSIFQPASEPQGVLLCLKDALQINGITCPSGGGNVITLSTTSSNPTDLYTAMTLARPTT